MSHTYIHTFKSKAWHSGAIFGRVKEALRNGATYRNEASPRPAAIHRARQHTGSHAAVSTPQPHRDHASLQPNHSNTQGSATRKRGSLGQAPQACLVHTPAHSPPCLDMLCSQQQHIHTHNAPAALASQHQCSGHSTHSSMCKRGGLLPACRAGQPDIQDKEMGVTRQGQAKLHAVCLPHAASLHEGGNLCTCTSLAGNNLCTRDRCSIQAVILCKQAAPAWDHAPRQTHPTAGACVWVGGTNLAQ